MERVTDRRHARGAAGEDAAVALLRRSGYRILARNYRCPRGELDIVAEDGDELVFVEVRTRRPGAMVGPLESIDARKQRQIVRAAEQYLLAKGGFERPWRVDVVAVELNAAGQVALLEHLRCALG